MPRLFDRFWQVTVQVSDTEAIRTESMDIEFRVLRGSKVTPNSATIVLWNLNETHRSQLYARNRPDGPSGRTVPINVQLDAGYQEQHGVLLSADLRELATVRDGTNWKTTLSVDDGGVAVREYRFPKGGVCFAKGTPVGEVLKQVAGQMGVGLGNVADFYATAEILGLHMTTLPGPMTFEGSVFDAMVRLTQTIGVKRKGQVHGITFSIQNGVIQMQVQGQPVNTDAVLLTPKTGLVGSPEAAIDSASRLGFARKGKQSQHSGGFAPVNTSTLKAKSLLNVGIVPGRVVRLESDAFNGDYVATDCEYRGQSFGKEWNVDMVLRSYDNG